MAQKHLIYYAHPMSWYGTEYERKALDQIVGFFPEDTIYNPGAPEVDVRCGEFEMRTGLNPMAMFLDLIVRHVDGVVYSPFCDGRIGAGVALEITQAVLAGKPVYELREGHLYLTDRGTLPARNFLTIEQTKLRIRNKQK